MLLGLVVNLGLNWWFIQVFGLFGAVAATSAANLFTLLLLMWRMSANHCHLGRGTLGLCLAPLAIVAGPVMTSGVLVALVFIAGRTEWFLSAADREQIDAAALPVLRRCGLRLSSLWP
jgi:O-antigen/teichoic acid export membrane protein